MAAETKGDYQDVGTPSGEYDHLGHLNNNSDDLSEHGLERASVPETHDDNSDENRKSRKTDAKSVKSWISTHSRRTGLLATPEMTNYIMSCSAEDDWQERDVELFLKGYVFCMGSRLIPNIQASVMDIQTEVRNLQRENNKGVELMKSMEKQGKSVEMEIASAVATIKTDMISAIKSATIKNEPVDNKKGIVLKVRKESVPANQKPIVEIPNVKNKSKSPDPSLVIKVEDEDEDDLCEKKRDFMDAVGVDAELISVLSNEEIHALLPTNDYYEFVGELADEEVRIIWFDEIMKGVEELDS